MTVHPFRRIGLVAVAALLGAACSSAAKTSQSTAPRSSGDSPATSGADPAATTPVSDASGDTAGGAGETITIPSASAVPANPNGPVKVRLVNLVAPNDHPEGVTLNGFLEGDTFLGATDGTGTPTFGSVAYGQVGDYVGADLSKVGDIAFFIDGQKTPVAISNIDGSVPGRYTLIAYAGDQPGQVAIQGFNETPTAKDVNEKFPGSLAAAPDGKVLIVADGGPLQYIGSRNGFNLGQPGKGCFALQVPDGPTSGQTNIPSGGSLNYVADPGSLQVAFFDSLDGDCSKTPVIAPVAVTVAAGDRLIVVGYGASPTTLALMSIPVNAFAGDPPLVPGPTTSTEAPVSAVGPCTVITADQAAAALGAPVDGSGVDDGAGTCVYTAGVATLTIEIQSNMTKEAFDTIVSGSGDTKPVSGIGDAAVLTSSDPVGIIVLQGTTLFAVGLDHHADAGPDDPAVDVPLIEQVAKDALHAF